MDQSQQDPAETQELDNSDDGAEIRMKRAVEASSQFHCVPFPALVSYHKCTHLNIIVMQCSPRPLLLLSSSRNFSKPQPHPPSPVSVFFLSLPHSLPHFTKILFLNKCLMLSNYKLKYILRKQLG